jgi:hypothetical protein
MIEGQGDYANSLCNPDRLVDPSGCHLKSWFVEMSADGESCCEVACEEDTKPFNGRLLLIHLRLWVVGTATSASW